MGRGLHPASRFDGSTYELSFDLCVIVTSLLDRNLCALVIELGSFECSLSYVSNILVAYNLKLEVKLLSYESNGLSLHWN